MLPPARALDHRIELQGSMPKPAPIYRLTPLEDRTLKEHIMDALEKGLIRPSRAPWGAAVFFVQKKDGSLRLVTDY